ncbi:MAG: DUF1732 domain-containing protein [Fusobacterium sp.]|nr:DUF1732 domain-containing protein [Fusobacterium sp.]
MKNPIISVIIPVYNTEKYLRQCLDSVVNQTYKNLEIICINDSSPDNSLAILEEYAAKDERIIVINQKNAGVSAARNAGLDRATGEYIAFVDSDDWIEPECYELAILKMENDETIDLISWSANVIDNRNSLLKDYQHMQQWHEMPFSGKQKLSSNIVSRIIMAPWCHLYKKDIIDKLNLKFLNYKISEDLLFNTMYMSKITEVYFIDKKLYNYVLQPNSAIVKFSVNDPLFALRSHIDAALACLETYKKQGKELFFCLNIFQRYYNTIRYDIRTAEITNSLTTIINLLNKLVNNLDEKYDYINDIKIIKKQEYYRLDYLNIPWYSIGNTILGFQIFKINKPKIILHLFGIKICIHYQNIFSIKNSSQNKHKIVTLLNVKLKLKKHLTAKEKLKNIINKIFYIKNKNNHKIINCLGLKLKFKRPNTNSHYTPTIATNNSELKNYISNEVFAANMISTLHQKTFPQYKNCNYGKNLIIVASGPTMKYYKPIKDGIHIGVNKAYQNKNITMDYIFVQDKVAVLDYIDEIIAYPSQKFIGSYLTKEYPWIGKCCIPMQYWGLPNLNYYISDFSRNLAFPYLEYYGLMDYSSVVFPATQFALYTQPKRIYLVGCDCSSGYFDGTKNTKLANPDMSHLIESWKKFKKYQETYYPDIEIISINPIGLKGVFKDVYTPNFVNDNPEVFNNTNLTLINEEEIICQ